MDFCFYPAALLIEKRIGDRVWGLGDRENN
jgi:hypothetical protein